MGGGKKSIGYGTIHRDETTTLDLKFFADLIPDGMTCFPDIDGDSANGLHNYRLMVSMQIYEGRRGRAQTQLTFFAKTVNNVEVLYRLDTIGYFETLRSDWPPSVPGDSGRATLKMNEWEMRLNNGQEEYESTSCLMEGIWDPDDESDPVPEWKIDVSLIP